MTESCLTLIEELEQSLNSDMVSFDDIECLEEIVTPGTGSGCNCNSTN